MKKIYFLLSLIIVSTIITNEATYGQNPVFTDTLSIGQSFSSDTTIYPFNNQQLYGIATGGSVQFNSYTSYIRILVTDTNNVQFMIFESNPMLDTVWNFTFNTKCDETCFLNNFAAQSISFHVQDANLTLNLLEYTQASLVDASEMQYNAKLSADADKITRINNFLESKQMLWRAGETYYSNLFFNDRVDPNYGLDKYAYGFEFYIGGVFEIYGKSGAMNEPTYDIAPRFDWRSRHGADEANTPYYDGDETGSGWMTGLKCQTGCWVPDGNGSGEWLCISESECCGIPGGDWRPTGACSGFATISTIEGFANLFFNQHINFDLSEQQLASFPEEVPFDNCAGILYGGGFTDTYHTFIDYGVIGESDFPWQGVYVPCDEQTYPPNEKVTLSGYTIIPDGLTATSLKTGLIENGPMSVAKIYPLAPNHAVTFVGFDVLTVGDEFTLADDIVIVVPDHYSTTDIPIWIFKDNYGLDSRLDGYFYIILYEEPSTIAYPNKTGENPITSLNYDEEDILIRDEDNDGYLNWGIGDCVECPGERDGDDHNASLGPVDANGFCTIIDTYTTSFEGKGYENWTQSGEDDFDWLKHNDAPYASSYGPEGAYDGDFYMLFEGIYHQPNSSGDEVILESPPIDLASECLISLNFHYFRYFDNGGVSGAPELKVQASSDNGETWYEVWQADNPIADPDWNEATVQIFSMVNKIRFVGQFGVYPPQNNIGIDMITITPYEQTGPLIISHDTWLNGDIYACDDIIVEPGAILTIGTNCMLHIPEGHKIVVKRQASLFINGGTITNDGSGQWKGIEVWGNNAALSTPYLYQGYVRLWYGGTIENAECAFKAIRISETTDETLWEYSGGIVKVNNGNLVNNTSAAKFYPYSVDESFSTFNNCTVTIDDNLNSIVNPEEIFRLQNIDGIGFQDVTISDDRTNVNIAAKPTGIYAIGANFTVNGDNNSGVFTTSFNNLKYGIKVLGSDPTDHFTVETCGFYNNLRGIYTSGTTGDQITLCEFQPYENATPFLENYCLYLDECTDYVVEENLFENVNTTTIKGNGIVVNNSGSDPNQIYRNTFIGLDYGIIAQNENRSTNGLTGLCLKCNDFDVCNNDIVITHIAGTETPQQGIAANQGASSSDPEDMAGNLFYIESLKPDGDFDDINNQANHITYYVPNYAPPGVLERLTPVDYTENTVTIIVVNNDWNFEDGCPSNLGGGGGGTGDGETLLAKVNGASNTADSLQNILDVLVDAGNTEELEAIVYGSTAPETMEIYTELMNTSPYLSDTVISTAIQKEDVFPGALMRDIMVANPHTAKSDQLLQQLLDRWDPLPNYMLAQILQGRSLVSIREETESKLAASKLKQNRAVTALANYYFTDTVNPSASMAGLSSLLAYDNNLHSKYVLAFLKLKQNDIEAGENILATIPSFFELTARQQLTHQEISSYFQLRSNLLADSLNILQADSILVENIWGIVEADCGLPSVLARNILLAMGETVYTEPVILPDMYKATEAVESYNKLLEAKAPRFVKVKPNPAKDYIILDYLLETGGNCSFKIRNQDGRLVYTIETLGVQDELTIDTRSWQPGLYIVSLIQHDKLIESTKFTIIK